MLMRHSGRQLGGGPRSSGKQVQDDEPSGVTVHREFGPQGEGLHGSLGVGESPISILFERGSINSRQNGEGKKPKFNIFNNLPMGKQLTKGFPV